jgi:hypothetical protein
MTKVFLAKSQCILNANVIAVIEGLINYYYKEKENTNKIRRLIAQMFFPLN